MTYGGQHGSETLGLPQLCLLLSDAGHLRRRARAQGRGRSGGAHLQGVHLPEGARDRRAAQRAWAPLAQPQASHRRQPGPAHDRAGDRRNRRAARADPRGVRARVRRNVPWRRGLGTAGRARGDVGLYERDRLADVFHRGHDRPARPHRGRRLARTLGGRSYPSSELRGDLDHRRQPDRLEAAFPPEPGSAAQGPHPRRGAAGRDRSQTDRNGAPRHGTSADHSG